MTHVDRGEAALPAGASLARTTATFTEASVPDGLLREHRIADEVWGRLVVDEGRLTLVFEDDASGAVRLDAGERAVIPPARPHHVELDGPVRFAVEFHVVLGA